MVNKVGNSLRPFKLSIFVEKTHTIVKNKDFKLKMPLLDKQRTKKFISVSVNVKIAILQVFGKDVGSKYIACKYLPVMFCFFLQ